VIAGRHGNCPAAQRLGYNFQLAGIAELGCKLSTVSHLYHTIRSITLMAHLPRCSPADYWRADPS
jgi:hypothetical protein